MRLPDDQKRTRTHHQTKSILGLDLGPEHSAYTVLHGAVIGDHAWIGNERFLDLLRGDLAVGQLTVLESPQPQDRPLGRMLRDTIVLAGRVIEIFKLRGLPLVEVDECDARCWLCGSRSSNNSALRQALLDEFGDTRQVPCGDCNSTGAAAGARGPKKCPTCKGSKFVRIPGPLSRLNEHERSALAAALYYRQFAESRAA